MAAVTLLGTPTFDTNAGDKTVTATPAVNDLIVICTACNAIDETTNVTDDNASGTYTKIISGDRSATTPFNRVDLWIRTALIGSAVSTIFTAAQAGSGGGGLVVLSVTGMTQTGASAARSSGAENNAPSGTPAPVLSLTPLSTNPIVGAISKNSTAAMTERTGYTEQADVNHLTPSSSLEVMSLNSGETSATITWGSVSGTAFGSLAVELDASGAAPPPALTGASAMDNYFMP